MVDRWVSLGPGEPSPARAMVAAEVSDLDELPPPRPKRPRKPRRGRAASGATPALGALRLLTLRGGQLTQAVLANSKDIENRHFHLRPGWYWLHVSTRRAPGLEPEQAAKVATLGTEAVLFARWRGKIVGAVKLDAGRPIDQLDPPSVWAERRRRGKTFCHRITQVIDFSALGTVPARGNLSPTRVPSDTEQRCRALVAAAGGDMA